MSKTGRELIYARSPAPGEIEIVVSKNHEAKAYKLSELEIATLWGALSEAIRHNYVGSLSPSRDASATRVGANGQADRNPPRPMGNNYYEGMIWVPGLGYFKDKSHRKYGKA